MLYTQITITTQTSITKASYQAQPFYSYIFTANMSVVSLLGVKVLNNPAKFGDSYHFEITFECLEQLQKGRRSPFVKIAESGR